MSASKWLVQRILYRSEHRLPVRTKTRACVTNSRVSSASRVGSGPAGGRRK